MLGVADTVMKLMPRLQDLLRYDLAPERVCDKDALSNALVGPVGEELYRSQLLRHLDELLGNHVELTGAEPKTPILNGRGRLQASDIFFVALKRQPSVTLMSNSTFMAPQTQNPSATVLFDDISDERKIDILTPFLRVAAGEIHSKVQRWRAVQGVISADNHHQDNQVEREREPRRGTASMLSISPAQAALSPSLRNRSSAPMEKERVKDRESDREVIADHSLNWTTHSTAAASLDHALGSLPVPLSRQAVGIPKEWRAQNIFLDNDEERNLHKIKAIFGPSVVIAQRERPGRRLTSSIPADATEDAEYGNLPAISLDPEREEEREREGERGRARGYVSTLTSVAILKRLRALDVPPLPVTLGSPFFLEEDPDVMHHDGQSATMSTSPVLVSAAASAGRSSSWRPREQALLCTLREHTQAVSRLAVSTDQRTFASASLDGTVRLWQTKSLDKVAFPRSVATYAPHDSAALDLAAMENSNSFVSCYKNGEVHVWRADYVSSGKPLPSKEVAEKALIRRLVSNPQEGAALAVQHFHNDVASVVVYATQKGTLHGWDLRSAREAFTLTSRPEVGTANSLTVAPDRNWLCLGHSTGCISLFDIRFNTLTSLWRHSSCRPVHRLACCKAVKYNYNAGSTVPGLPSTEGAYLFVAAENNEAAVFGLPEGGECFKCFRSLSLDESKAAVAPLPSLDSLIIPRHGGAPINIPYKT
jgi:hypothetical protein